MRLVALVFVVVMLVDEPSDWWFKAGFYGGFLGSGFTALLFFVQNKSLNRLECALVLNLGLSYQLARYSFSHVFYLVRKLLRLSFVCDSRGCDRNSNVTSKGNPLKWFCARINLFHACMI